MQLELAELRNLISLRQVDERDIDRLKNIKRKAAGNSGPFSSLIEQAIENCLKDIEKNDFKSASHEIHLIHNLPYSMKDLSSWDEVHFYKIELLSYLENIADTEKIKMLVANIADAQSKIKKYRE